MTFLNELFNLSKGEDDKGKTLDSVKNNISFTGANLWILVCAIIVASVGLNVNSTAVIIGAMLISPLMGPIVGSGFALGIYDFNLLRKSLRNLIIATLTGLVVSTVYFYASPFKEAQSEILMRTSPNIYDVLIAFFGGLVGVIAVTRLEKGNPIPGVAIATALMPPLCTAGYGLATGNIRFFLGSLFLYTINCVFICIATFTIVKYLQYPSKEIDAAKRMRVRLGISVIIILMLIPSAYFAFTLFEQQKFTQTVNKYIEQEFTLKGNTIIYKKTDYNNKPKLIELAFLSKRFSKEEILELNDELSNYGLSNTELVIKQDSTDNIQKLKSDILNEVKSDEVSVNEKDTKIKLLEEEILKNTYDNKKILDEAKILFPTIDAVSLANHTFANDSNITDTAAVLVYETKTELSNIDKMKLENWIKEKFSLKKIEVFRKPEENN